MRTEYLAGTIVLIVAGVIGVLYWVNSTPEKTSISTHANSFDSSKPPTDPKTADRNKPGGSRPNDPSRSAVPKTDPAATPGLRKPSTEPAVTPDHTTPSGIPRPAADSRPSLTPPSGVGTTPPASAPATTGSSFTGTPPSATPTTRPSFTGTAPPSVEPRKPDPKPETRPAVKPELTPPAKPAATQKSHTIADGDTLVKIAREYLGDGEQWRKIKEANPGIDERKLHVGTKLVIPAAGATTAASGDRTSAADPGTKPSAEKPNAGAAGAKPVAAGGARTYTVQSGDRLAAIARRTLNDHNRWKEIYELNRDKISDPNMLVVGAVLKLPADAVEPKPSTETKPTTRRASDTRSSGNGARTPTRRP